MKKAYINGFVLDGSLDMEAREGLVVITEGSQIIDVKKKEDVGVDALKDCEIVNLRGKYLMPGLINLHVHIPGSGKISKETSDTKKVVKLVLSNPITRAIGTYIYQKAAETTVKSGVTTIRSAAGIATYDTELRDKIEAGKLVGPRVLASNMAIAPEDGHMAGSMAYEVFSADEAAEMVHVIASDDPDWIKLMITGGVLDAKEAGSPGELKMPLEYVKAACDEAHKLGLPVAAHVESLEGVKVALRGGVDTVEHGATLDEEAIKLFKETGAAVVQTITPALYFSVVDKKYTEADEKDSINGNIIFEGMTNCAKTCIEEGIPLGMGNDSGCPFSPQYGFWRELVCMVKYVGVDNRYALHTATLGNARIVGIDDITGSIEPGKSADMIVLDENPLENLETLRNPSMVIARGEKVKKLKIKKYEDIEKILDETLAM
ncbi:MAG: amidohydrolase family protein [Mogibacterium sp.]|nr:amidohydrolase family protein [Mogibacterium sp.]